MMINNAIIKQYLLKKKLITNNESVKFKEVGRGAFNLNYLVEASGVKYFLFRFILWSMRDHLGNMAEYESRVLKNLAGLDISPDFILKDDSGKIFTYPLIIEKYFNGKTMKQSNKNFVKQIITALPLVVKLHQKGKVNGLTPQSKIISRHLFAQRIKYFKKHGSPCAKLLDSNKNSIDRFVKQCNKILNKESFVHGDLNPENFIFTLDGQWRLVDWQSSFVGDPAFDIATLLWDFYGKFFAGKLLNAKQKFMIKKKYCELSNTDIKELDKKIKIITIFLDLDMLLRVEFMHTRLTKDSNFLKIENEEKKFIIQKRVSPARKLLVNQKNIYKILEALKSSLDTHVRKTILQDNK
jgi:thiamine kinase-like enzyme